MPIHSENLRRYDLKVEDAHTIVYLSDVALRIALRDGHAEKDTFVAQHRADGAIEGVLVGATDAASAKNISDAAAEIASFLLKSDTFSDQELLLLTAAANPPAASRS